MQRTILPWKLRCVLCSTMGTASWMGWRSLPWPIVNRCAICEWHLWNPDTSSAKGTSLCGSEREKRLNNSWEELLCRPLRRNTSAVRRPELCFPALSLLLWLAWYAVDCITWELNGLLSWLINHLVNCSEYFYLVFCFLCIEDHSLMLGTFSNTDIESHMARLC